ncbi:Cubilin [Aphis craccivora]|uniref:Cubilin n=1 Tax=Aphis craccivora TaxID=307492 RepID=A0A6G0ZF73_APHCR|nr:Cubilin [Aphis craccivora]
MYTARHEHSTCNQNPVQSRNNPLNPLFAFVLPYKYTTTRVVVAKVVSCVSGHLELVDSFGQGSGPRICGKDERLAPPIIMFADRESAVLNFRIEEATSRSQFLAYFSFTSLTNVHGLAFRPKGGRRIEHTICDWLYQDFSCNKDSCTLASPGFPGIYGTNLYCKYHITTSSVHTQVRLQFLTLSLPLK